MEIKKEVEETDKENHLKSNVPETLAVEKSMEPLVIPKIPKQEELDETKKNDVKIAITSIESDSDDEFAYSQRINQEIKSELMDMDEIFENNDIHLNDDSKYINSDEEIILIDSDDDEVSKKGADKWFAILSQNSDHSLIKKEPIDEHEDEIKENNILPSTSCVIKLTDVLLQPDQLKSRSLKKNVRELLKSISSDGSSSEDDEKPVKEEILKIDKNKIIETRKRLQSICSSSSSSDENIPKKIKVSGDVKIKSSESEKKTKLSIKTKKIHRSSTSSDENRRKKFSSESHSEEDEKRPAILEIKKSQHDNLSGDDSKQAPASIQKPKKTIQRKPKIIEPPHLPAKRGMHRGISIDTSEKMLKRAKITSRRPTLTFGSEELTAKHEKEKMVELRKAKLKELAEAEAAKKKLKQDEAKVVNTPKVKLTKSNRGAFLTEDTIPKPSSRIVIKNPTRIEAAMLPKIPRIKRKSECETIEPEPVQEELFTIIVPKKSNLKNFERSSKNNKKKVRFNETPEIRFYQIDDGNILSDKAIMKDAPTTNSMQPSRNNERKEKDPNKHRVQDVLTQVTEWPPEWFDEQFITNNGSPPVNGVTHLLLPMVHEFKSFNDYEK